MTDDGTNDMLSMFVADTPGDLSAGELFAAKLNQDSAENGGTFTIEWVSLGRAFVRLGNAWADLGAFEQARTFTDRAQTLLLGNPQENVRLSRELAELLERLQGAS